MKKKAVCPKAIAACTADLLIVSLKAVRESAVKHETDIGLVDPHSKRDGRHDHVNLVVLKLALILPAIGIRHACVIGERRHAVLKQLFT